MSCVFRLKPSVWWAKRKATQRAEPRVGPDQINVSMISAREALERLREGNRRFLSGAPTGDTLTSQMRRTKLAAGQAPFAIVLGCSDSRVAADIVFDQGLGDLFVIPVLARRLE